MKVEYLQKILDAGFNIIPITSDKRPTAKWADYQTEKIKTVEQVGSASKNWALICGFNDVECIDIDLNIFTNTV